VKITHIVSAVVACAALVIGLSKSQAQGNEERYRFVMVSHIGANDPNMLFLTVPLEDFKKRYPNVTVDYVSTNAYSIQEHIRLLEQTIASRPDGIAVPIVSSEAFEGPVRQAIDAGIPVVAFNIPDTRPQESRIPYLTYVGGDEYLSGLHVGQYAVSQAKAGKTQNPKRAVCLVHDAAHQGLRARCNGMRDAMAEAGAQTDDLFVGADPAGARNALQSYLQANSDTTHIYTVTDVSVPWIYDVAKEMNLQPDIGPEGVTILAMGEGPSVTEGIKAGRVLASASQGFWLQGFLPVEWLYWNKKYGYAPQTDIITGPVLITSDNADQWAEHLHSIFGDKLYDEQNTW